jgi:hypothetical protein
LLFDARQAFNGASRMGNGQFAVNYDEATDANIFIDSHGGVVGDNRRRFYEG